MAAVIKIQNLDFSYNGNKVLENINLEVEAKDFLGVVGPNGGGKTTLLKLILGLIGPDSGTIEILDNSPVKSRNAIGYVPQYNETDKFFPINVNDVVAMGLANKRTFFPGLNKSEQKKTSEVLEYLKISNLAKNTFGELSGGQKQRCLIARALLSEPKILLLDEPTASVDSSVEEDIYDLLKKLNEEITILFVSHDLGFISSYVNRIACINKNLVCHDKNEVSSDEVKSVYHDHTAVIKHKCGL